jgi:hypothetical protein
MQQILALDLNHKHFNISLEAGRDKGRAQKTKQKWQCVECGLRKKESPSPRTKKESLTYSELQIWRAWWGVDWLCSLCISPRPYITFFSGVFFW